MKYPRETEFDEQIALQLNYIDELSLDAIQVLSRKLSECQRNVRNIILGHVTAFRRF